MHAVRSPVTQQFTSLSSEQRQCIGANKHRCRCTFDTQPAQSPFCVDNFGVSVSQIWPEIGTPRDPPKVYKLERAPNGGHFEFSSETL